MDVDTEQSPRVVPGTTREQTYYFCGPGCNRAFQKEPEGYLSGEQRLDMDG